MEVKVLIVSEKVQYKKSGAKKEPAFVKSEHVNSVVSICPTYSVHHLYKVFLTQNCIFNNAEKNLPELEAQAIFTLDKWDANVT